MEMESPQRRLLNTLLSALQDSGLMGKGYAIALEWVRRD